MLKQMLSNTRDELHNATVHINTLSAEFGNIKCLQDEYIGILLNINETYLYQYSRHSRSSFSVRGTSGSFLHSTQPSILLVWRNFLVIFYLQYLLLVHRNFN